MSAGPNPAGTTLNVTITPEGDDETLLQTHSKAPTLGNDGKVVPQPELVFGVKLFNSMGVLVLQTTAAAGSVPLDVSGLPNGLYILHVYDGSDNPPQTQHIVISH